MKKILTAEQKSLHIQNPSQIHEDSNTKKIFDRKNLLICAKYLHKLSLFLNLKEKKYTECDNH